MQKELEQIYTRGQTAKLLGVPYAKIWKLVREGYIATTADGRHITQTEINKFLTPTKTSKHE